MKLTPHQQKALDVLRSADAGSRPRFVVPSSVSAYPGIRRGRLAWAPFAALHRKGLAVVGVALDSTATQYALRRDGEVCSCWECRARGAS